MHAVALRVLLPGRWPVKSAKFLRGLLKNAEANAIANELTPEDLVIRNIVVQQAPVRGYRSAGVFEDPKD
jgi:large subunit ribosomal protein L17e